MSEPERKISKAMQRLAATLDKDLAGIAGERMGFMLLVFPLNRLGACNRVSNCDRGAAIDLLQKTLDWMKRVEGDAPFHQVH